VYGHELIDQIALPFDVKKVDFGTSKRRGHSVTIDAWDDRRVPEDFRVDTKVELWDLFACFQFPDKMKSKWGHKFTGEEVFLFGMYRLCNVFKLQNQIVTDVFGFHYAQLASECFHCFLHFMVTNWGYLLTNNFDFWVPHLQSCSASIRFKAIEKGVTFPREFNIFGFTDNTMNSSCRPGGGPARDGEQAPRNDPNLQRAWYNGWKKLHGLKWQTVDLPNGMNAHVWGACSVRHNDIWMLNNSNLNAIIAAAQMDQPHQYCIYGDSAYATLYQSHRRARHNYDDLNDRENIENRVMSSLRETIEWDYGDVARYFPFVKVKQVLKMRRMPVADIYLTAMIMRNALNTIKPNNTAIYYSNRPPTLAQWTAQGPNARPHIVPVIPILA